MAITNFSPRTRNQQLDDEVLTPLRQEFRNVVCVLDTARSSGGQHYSGIAFPVFVQ